MDRGLKKGFLIYYEDHYPFCHDIEIFYHDVSVFKGICEYLSTELKNVDV